MIEGAKGICRLCFEPAWEDQKLVVSGSKYYYHENCVKWVPDLDQWEEKHKIRAEHIKKNR